MLVLGYYDVLHRFRTFLYIQRQSNGYALPWDRAF